MGRPRDPARPRESHSALKVVSITLDPTVFASSALPSVPRPAIYSALRSQG